MKKNSLSCLYPNLCVFLFCLGSRCKLAFSVSLCFWTVISVIPAFCEDFVCILAYSVFELMLLGIVVSSEALAFDAHSITKTASGCVDCWRFAMCGPSLFG